MPETCLEALELGRQQVKRETHIYMCDLPGRLLLLPFIPCSFSKSRESVQKLCSKKVSGASLHRVAKRRVWNLPLYASESLIISERLEGQRSDCPADRWPPRSDWGGGPTDCWRRHSPPGPSWGLSGQPWDSASRRSEMAHPQLALPLKWKSLSPGQDTDPPQAHTVSRHHSEGFSDSVSESIITCRKLKRKKRNKRRE